MRAAVPLAMLAGWVPPAVAALSGPLPRRGARGSLGGARARRLDRARRLRRCAPAGWRALAVDAGRVRLEVDLGERGCACAAASERVPPASAPRLGLPGQDSKGARRRAPRAEARSPSAALLARLGGAQGGAAPLRHPRGRPRQAAAAAPRVVAAPRLGLGGVRAARRETGGGAPRPDLRAERRPAARLRSLVHGAGPRLVAQGVVLCRAPPGGAGRGVALLASLVRCRSGRATR